jgi:glutamate transport system permease protein
MSSVLFDTPGPRALRRQRIASAVTVLVLLVVAALVVRKLYVEDQFTAEKWEPFVTPDYVEALLRGMLTTVRTAAVAIVFSIAFGTIFAVGRLSERIWLSWPSTVVVEFFRAVPLLMLILAMYLVYDFLGTFWSLVIGLTLYNGSVLAEVFRAGVLAVPRGQSEAAYGIGLRRGQVMRLVLLPQAARIMLPAIISQSVVVLKDTSLGYVITFQEAVFVGRAISIEFHNSLATGIVLATMYIIINYSLSRLAVWLEARLSRNTTAVKPAGYGMDVGGGGGAAATG